jgi:hypothetical protein
MVGQPAKALERIGSPERVKEDVVGCSHFRDFEERLLKEKPFTGC